MDLASRLILLADVVEQGSYSKAAKLNKINRSAVSKQIQHLEEELKVRLFQRSTRSICHTDV